MATDSDYAYLRDLVLTQSSQLIDPLRHSLFETRLTPIAHLAGAANLEGLVKILRVDRPGNLQRAVVEAMTLHETGFFRDAHVFDNLRMDVLPRLIESRKAQRRLRLWSAACSTGKEAYSLAILLADSFPELHAWDVRIVATDSAPGVVDFARTGHYRDAEMLRGLSPRVLSRYFEREGAGWRIDSGLRALCEFEVVNLCARLPRLPVFDLVLLRNVLLFLPPVDRGAVFRSVHQQIAPDGFLLLGNAEQAEDSTDLFVPEAGEVSYFYRPVSASSMLPAELHAAGRLEPTLPNAVE